MTSRLLVVLLSFALIGTFECAPASCDSRNVADEIVNLQNVNVGSQILVFHDELEPDGGEVHAQHAHVVSTLEVHASVHALMVLEEEAVNVTDEVANRAATYPLLDWVTLGSSKQTATNLTEAVLSRLPLGHSLRALANVSFRSWSSTTSLLSVGQNYSRGGATTAWYSIDVRSPRLMFPILIPLIVVICGVTTACVSLSFPSENDPALQRESGRAGYDDEPFAAAPRDGPPRGASPGAAHNPMAAIRHAQPASPRSGGAGLRPSQPA